MDASLTDEQQMLASLADDVAKSIGVHHVDDIAMGSDEAWQVLAATGLLGLRVPAAAGGSAASAVEIALAAEALGQHLCPVPFLGSAVLATDLLAAAGASTELLNALAMGTRRLCVAVTPDGLELGVGNRPDLYGWDAAGAEAALALGDDRALSALPLDKSAPDKSALGKPDGHDLDLTRAIVPARGQPDRALGGELVLGGILSAQALMRWEALALSTACADLVGLMAGSLQAAVAYAAERVQFGVPIGSFQAVRHMCANQLIETEAARSVTRYAAWAVDELAVEEALLAARTAKAFCARAASKVIESGIQVHGGMGYTWECLDHLRLRRAITSSNLLGGEHHQTRQIARTRPRGHR